MDERFRSRRRRVELLRGVREGNSYVVTSHGRPVARLVPIRIAARGAAAVERCGASRSLPGHARRTSDAQCRCAEPCPAYRGMDACASMPRSTIGGRSKRCQSCLANCHRSGASRRPQSGQAAIGRSLSLPRHSRSGRAASPGRIPRPGRHRDGCRRLRPDCERLACGDTVAIRLPSPAALAGSSLERSPPCGCLGMEPQQRHQPLGLARRRRPRRPRGSRGSARHGARPPRPARCRPGSGTRSGGCASAAARRAARQTDCRRPAPSPRPAPCRLPGRRPRRRTSTAFCMAERRRMETVAPPRA